MRGSRGGGRVVLRLVACALIAVSLAALATWADRVGKLARFEHAAEDRVYPVDEIADEVVVVGIDASSVAQFDQQWPWPRRRVAALVDRLRAAGTRAIALDVVFPGPAEGDEALADAVRRSERTVLGALPIGAEAESSPGHPPVVPSVLRSVAPVTDAGVAVAHVAVTPDPLDGVVRWNPVAVEDGRDRRVYPSLAAATFAVATGASPTPIIRADGTVEVAGRVIPTDDHAAMRISWPASLARWNPGPGMFSAADVLAGRVPDADLAGKVVFVGSVDPTLGDFHVTPVASGAGEPGVLIHAAAYNTIAMRNYEVRASSAEVFAWAFVAALVVALAVQFLPVWAAIAAALAAVPASLLAAYLRAGTGTIPAFVTPALALATAVPLSGLVRYVVTERRRRRVTALFSQYVPDSVARELVDRPDLEQLIRGQRLEAAALFCDLRGFTALSAAMPATEVNRMLGHFYEYATNHIRAAGGTVVQFTGDEVYAVFGAPLPQPEAAATAARCAVELQESVDELDRALRDAGFQPLRFGIGINFGEVVSAHVGMSRRRQYSVLGDTVNVASRLCGRAGPGQVVVADSVLRAMTPRPAAERLEGPPMKGVTPDFVAWTLSPARTPSGTAGR